ncbi:hypothetical protein BD413DRAFT_559443 [Trametes elegans]|nr:hypothetical protein BD413DRAFT_559443 [Trametes elegans]
MAPSKTRWAPPWNFTMRTRLRSMVLRSGTPSGAGSLNLEWILSCGRRSACLVVAMRRGCRDESHLSTGEQITPGMAYVHHVVLVVDKGIGLSTAVLSKPLLPAILKFVWRGGYPVAPSSVGPEAVGLGKAKAAWKFMLCGQTRAPGTNSGTPPHTGGCQNSRFWERQPPHVARLRSG